MLKKLTAGFGVVMLAVGVVGSLSGGHDHTMVGFGINATHNTVHIVSGIAALLMCIGPVLYARAFLFIFGAVYGLVTVGGFTGMQEVTLLLNINAADNLLHLAITAFCIGTAITVKQ